MNAPIGDFTWSPVKPPAEEKHTGTSSTKSQLAVLRMLWREWCDVVRLHARASKGRMQIDPERYRLLQQRLVGQCEQLARSNSADQRGFYLYLANLVRPWVTSDVFLRTDREILFDLFFRCQEISAELGDRRIAEILMKAVKPALLFLAVGIVAAVLALNYDALMAPPVRFISDMYTIVILKIRQNIGPESWILVGALVIVVAISFAWYTRKT